MTRALSIAALVLLSAGATVPAPAESLHSSGMQSQPPGVSRLDDSVRAVASMLRCPVCQGESIQESPAALAKEMRQVVREQLASGRSSEEVKAYFVSKYGEWILLEPKAEGANLTVYLAPVVVLIGGAVLILFAVKRWTRSAADSDPDSPAL